MKKLDNFSNSPAILAIADFKLAETNVKQGIKNSQNLEKQHVARNLAICDFRKSIVTYRHMV